MATKKSTRTSAKSKSRKKPAGRKKPTTRKKLSSRKKPVGKKAGSRKKTPSSAGSSGATTSTGGTAKPTSGKAGIRIRMYRVGFGDFFLITLKGAAGPLHILVDCGVHAGDLGSIGDAIADLKNETGGQLALIVMTHRHADHISGFASGADTFANFTVERVWMSWFEDPKNADAASFQATLAAVAANLQSTLAARAAPGDGELLNMAGNAIGVQQLDATGRSTSNAAALKVLHGGFKNPAPVDYYQAGDTPTLPDSLVKAGLAATILGPPIDPDLVAEMDGKGHQYLASNSDDSADPKRFNPAFVATAAAYPPEAFAMFSPTEIAKTIAQAQPDLMAAKATQINNTLNNQSLVILFTFAEKTLLFTGDAQWGNWQNFLFGGALGTAGHDGLTSQAKNILGKLDFYKVGHHGSTNATPIDAVNAMAASSVAMCSTQPGFYGKVANKSEVPRIPLVAALDQKMGDRIARSDQVDVSGANTTTIKAIAAEFPPGKLPSVFTAGPNGELYIDYEM